MDGLLGSQIMELFAEDELEVDRLFAAASSQFEQAYNSTTAPSEAPPTAATTAHLQAAPPSTTHLAPAPPSSTSLQQLDPVRFLSPKTDEEIRAAREAGIPKKTQQDTKFCVNVYEEWRKNRERVLNTTIPPLKSMNAAEQAYHLTRFVVEARKKDGNEYPANTLHHIITGVMRHLRWHGIHVDFFRDPEFADMRSTLDSEMKRIQASGIGSRPKQAEIISEEEEELLWQKGLLGDSSPQVLLDTMVYCCGLFFALRSGNEHRSLRHSPCQIQVVERHGERAYLEYTEELSKNHPGGLRGRKVKQKIVRHHANTSHPERCFVRLFKRYRELCPADAPPHAFYFQPLRSPTETCWFSKRQLGHNTLGKTVARLCSSAGIQGYKTNHSLRATSTSRLYQSGAEEQQVMERTGHRSVEGVRSYKRTSEKQRQALSDILNKPGPSAKSIEHHSTEHHSTSSSAPSNSNTLSLASAQQHQHGIHLPSATFNNCNITFNATPMVGQRPDQTPPTKKRRAAIIYDSDSD